MKARKKKSTLLILVVLVLVSLIAVRFCTEITKYDVERIELHESEF